MLRRRDAGVGNICFVDVADPDYDPAKHAGISFEKAMERIHAVEADGTVLTGACGRGAWAAPPGLPGMRPPRQPPARRTPPPAPGLHTTPTHLTHALMCRISHAQTWRCFGGCTRRLVWAGCML